VAPHVRTISALDTGRGRGYVSLYEPLVASETPTAGGPQETLVRFDYSWCATVAGAGLPTATLVFFFGALGSFPRVLGSRFRAGRC